MTCNIEMAFFHTNFMLQTPHLNDHHHQEEPSTSIAPILPSCNPQEFHGVASLLGKRPSMSFTTGIDICEEMTNNNNNNGGDELSDDGSQVGEKKRRLNMEQVKTLEKNFELGNKLEPERKMQLARALGLQPRQIAIWFQNRRARWKTKQLEKDYELLKRQFDAVKAENDALQAHNQKLHAEIMTLKTREPTESINLNKETEGSCSNRSENSSEIKLDISRNNYINNNNPSIDSPSSNHHHPHHHPTATTSSRPLFPSSLGPARNGSSPLAVQQLFNSLSARPETTPGLKLVDPAHAVKEESLCNMFCGMDDQTGFWPWLEQQHFN